MNALVAFRANAVGNLAASRAQHQAARAEITAAFRDKIASDQRQVLKANGTAKAHDNPVDVFARDEISRDAFLQLLVMELQNQDPTDPMDSTQMITQLAQFSTLEAQMNLNESFEELNDSFEALVGNVDQLNFISAQGLLGHQVQGIALDGTIREGIVESVHLDGSIVVLSVEGQFLPMSGILSVAPGASAKQES